MTSGRWTLPPASIHPAGVGAGARLPASPAALRPLLGATAWSCLRTPRQDARVSTCPLRDRPRLELFRPGRRESRACLCRHSTPAGRTRAQAAGAARPLAASGDVAFRPWLPVWTTDNPMIAVASRDANDCGWRGRQPSSAWPWAARLAPSFARRRAALPFGAERY